jgi:hypothetical protein
MTRTLMTGSLWIIFRFGIHFPDILLRVAGMYGLSETLSYTMGTSTFVSYMNIANS